VFIFGKRFALKVLDEGRLKTVCVLEVAES
jgi:hypothetical protein